MKVAQGVKTEFAGDETETVLSGGYDKMVTGNRFTR